MAVVGADAEDAHEVDGVGGVLGLIEDPVLSQGGWSDAQGTEHAVDSRPNGSFQS